MCVCISERLDKALKTDSALFALSSPDEVSGIALWLSSHSGNNHSPFGGKGKNVLGPHNSDGVCISLQHSLRYIALSNALVICWWYGILKISDCK